MACTFTEENIRLLFGSEAAEDEKPERLKQYYLKAPIYEQVVADLPLRIVVGHKGIGKSALFKIAMQEDFENKRLAILIKPDDISSISLSSKDFLTLIREWKIGLMELVVTKVLKTVSKDASDIKTWLSAYGGRFLDLIKDFVKDNANIELSPAKQAIVENFLKDQKIYIYVDDLDRGWQGSKSDIRRISALLNAVRDLSNENDSMYFRIGLRSDVYYLVRTSDESTDKIENSVIWLKYSNHEIFCLLIKRIETFYGRKTTEKDLFRRKQDELEKYLRPVFVAQFDGYGKWSNYPLYKVLMSLIRKRPRDLVKLCTLSARHAREDGNTIITTKDLKSIFDEYSQGRLQDTINEYSSELPSIEKLLLNMKPSYNEQGDSIGYKMTTTELLAKLESLHPETYVFANAKVADSKMLAAFLYKINFLTARKYTDEGIIRKDFEENRYVSSTFTDFGFDWEIHPAYRWALQPDNKHVDQEIDVSYW